ncbi:MAG: M23 family metallopeptidase [Deltaproteobacteria bacterium]|nr:M23 family metallopeptidase [Deltaproteobacteria bacterium]
MKWKRFAMVMAGLALTVIICGLLVPENMVIPVKGATSADWNVKTFWFRPWGKSGVHRGIDIFAREGTSVIAACSGVVVFSDTLRDGGNVVAVLGPKWRVHYYAHLRSMKVAGGQFVSRGREIGTVGSTGNAVGKPPHLHYSIITQIPYVWRYKMERFGFDRMFYLDPGKRLIGEKRS